VSDIGHEFVMQVSKVCQVSTSAIIRRQNRLNRDFFRDLKPSCLAPLLHSDILPTIQGELKRMHVCAVRLQIRLTVEALTLRTPMFSIEVITLPVSDVERAWSPGKSFMNQGRSTNLPMATFSSAAHSPCGTRLSICDI